jgi:hypothetical protein
MLQYKVPKNVSIDDQIFFFLTLKQLIICGAGFSICYILYVLFGRISLVVWLIPSIIITFFTVLIAFFRFNGMSFFRTVLRLVELNTLPNKRKFYTYTDALDPFTVVQLTMLAGLPAPKPKAASTYTYVTDIDQLSHNVDLSSRLFHEE